LFGSLAGTGSSQSKGKLHDLCVDISSVRTKKRTKIQKKAPEPLERKPGEVPESPCYVCCEHQNAPMTDRYYGKFMMRPCKLGIEAKHRTLRAVSLRFWAVCKKHPSCFRHFYLKTKKKKHIYTNKNGTPTHVYELITKQKHDAPNAA
jgi:hypothetical protein